MKLVTPGSAGLCLFTAMLITGSSAARIDYGGEALSLSQEWICKSPTDAWLAARPPLSDNLGPYIKVSQLGRGSQITRVLAIWPTSKGAIFARFAPHGTTDYELVHAWGPATPLYRTHLEPIAVSFDQTAIATSEDQMQIYFQDGHGIRRLKLASHLLGCSLSPDGSRAAVYLVDGSTLIVRLNRPKLLVSSLRGLGLAGYPPSEWANECVAAIGPGQKAYSGAIWIIDSDTHIARSMADKIIAVSVYDGSFVALFSNGTVATLTRSAAIAKVLGKVDIRRIEAEPNIMIVTQDGPAGLFGPNVSIAYTGRDLLVVDADHRFMRFPLRP